MEKKLGKIEEVNFGIGGYQDAQIGFNFTFSGEGWGVSTQWEGFWYDKPTERAQWTEEDKVKRLGEAMVSLGEIMRDAKVTDVYQLKGIPVEATFEGMVLKEWRVLKEVL